MAALLSLTLLVAPAGLSPAVAGDTMKYEKTEVEKARGKCVLSVVVGAALGGLAGGAVCAAIIAAQIAAASYDRGPYVTAFTNEENNSKTVFRAVRGASEQIDASRLRPVRYNNAAGDRMGSPVPVTGGRDCRPITSSPSTGPGTTADLPPRPSAPARPSRARRKRDGSRLSPPCWRRRERTWWRIGPKGSSMPLPAPRPTSGPTSRPLSRPAAHPMPPSKAVARPANAGHRTAPRGNQVTYVDMEYVYREWLELQVRAGRIKREDVHAFWQRHGGDTLNAVKSYFPALKDTYEGQITVRLIVAELGLNGTYYIKQIRGRTHIVFRGFAGGRQFLTATHYGVGHSKIIHLKLGKAGLKAAAREGLIFGILFCTVIDIVDFATRDTATWGSFFGTLSMDITKGLIATGAAYAAGIGAAALMGTAVVAIGPVVAAIAVGVLLSFVLDAIDNRFDISGKLGRLVDQGLAKLAALAHALEARAVQTYHRIEHSQVVRDLSRETHELINWAGNHMPRITWNQLHL